MLRENYMIKMSSNKFMIVILIPLNILISFFYQDIFVSFSKSEVLEKNNLILLLLILVNAIILHQTIKRVRRYKKEKLEIEIKRRNSFFISVILFSVLSILALYFSYILENILLYLLAMFLILLAINGVICLKMLSGISASYVFYNGKQIAFEDIESYDINSRNIHIRTSNTLFFINVFEITSIPNVNNTGEKFEQILSKWKKAIAREKLSSVKSIN